MNMKNVCIISIFIIAIVAIGCIDKPTEKVSPIETPKDKTVDIKTSTEENTQDNVSVSKKTDNTSDNISTPVEENTKDNVSAQDNVSVSKKTDNTSDNISTSTQTPLVNTSIQDENAPINDTLVSEIFKIGDEKNILGLNVKLVNITDYDNGLVTFNIDGVEYKYDPEVSIQVKGVEMIDVTIAEDNTVEVTADYI